MEAVGVLVRVDAFEDGVLIDSPRKRQLDDVGGARRVGVEPLDGGDDLLL